MDFEELQRTLPDLPKHLGMTFTSVEKTRLTAEIVVRPDLCNPLNTLHGGAIMTFADTMGAVGTWINLAEGQTTTTIESKTNFIAAAPEGIVVTATTVPLHLGRRTHVWETTLTRPDGRIIAKVTQTQMVI